MDLKTIPFPLAQSTAAQYEILDAKGETIATVMGGKSARYEDCADLAQLFALAPELLTLATHAARQDIAPDVLQKRARAIVEKFGRQTYTRPETTTPARPRGLSMHAAVSVTCGTGRHARTQTERLRQVAREFDLCLDDVQSMRRALDYGDAYEFTYEDGRGGLHVTIESVE